MCQLSGLPKVTAISSQTEAYLIDLRHDTLDTVFDCIYVIGLAQASSRLEDGI